MFASGIGAKGWICDLCDSNFGENTSGSCACQQPYSYSGSQPDFWRSLASPPTRPEQDAAPQTIIRNLFYLTSGLPYKVTQVYELIVISTSLTELNSFDFL